MKEQSPEVLVCEGPLAVVSRADIEEIKRRAAASARRRARICGHADADEPLHEMLIVLDRRTYIRPHRHHGKAESLLVLEGAADIVFFDDRGGITRVLPVTPYGAGHTFYYRIADALYHTVLVRTDSIVFHEATTGPFRREQTEFATWSPAEGDEAAIAAYSAELERAIGRMTPA